MVGSFNVKSKQNGDWQELWSLQQHFAVFFPMRWLNFCITESSLFASSYSSWVSRLSGSSLFWLLFLETSYAVENLRTSFEDEVAS